MRTQNCCCKDPNIWHHVTENIREQIQRPEFGLPDYQVWPGDRLNFNAPQAAQ